MFVEHKEQGEVSESPAKVMKLSEAIRQGIPVVKESRMMHCGCAIGTGYTALTGRNLLRDYALYQGPEWNKFAGRVADVFKMPYAVVAQAEMMHVSGGSREESADWLESRGF